MKKKLTYTKNKKDMISKVLMFLSKGWPLYLVFGMIFLFSLLIYCMTPDEPTRGYATRLWNGNYL